VEGLAASLLSVAETAWVLVIVPAGVLIVAEIFSKKNVTVVFLLGVAATILALISFIFALSGGDWVDWLVVILWSLTAVSRLTYRQKKI